ncbi:MAG: FAD-dependent oxidoreductase [Deltaproteobacteria bacterium]|nr:FAD-dependent oxidoreductase [Deltaproteobacteria bacterium]
MAATSAHEPASGRRVYHATLTRIHEHLPGTRSLFLRLPVGERLAFTPGQFVSCELPVPPREHAADGAPLARAYSLASSPEDDELEICVDRVVDGPGSAYLFGLEPGAALAFTGPFGSFALAEPPDAHLVFVGEGAGVAPLRPMVRRALERGGTRPITVLHGARYEHELIYRRDFESWAARHPRLEWEPVLLTTEAEVGPIDALEELVLQRFVRRDADRTRRFWICGVGAMPGRLRDALRAAGYERKAVRAEQW